jgi:hypothetical protein
MTVHDRAIAKLRQLPKSLVQEMSDFMEFLLMKHNSEQQIQSDNMVSSIVVGSEVKQIDICTLGS